MGWRLSLAKKNLAIARERYGQVKSGFNKTVAPLKNEYHERHERRNEEREAYREAYLKAKYAGRMSRIRAQGYAAGRAEPVSTGAKIDRGIKQADNVLGNIFGKPVGRSYSETFGVGMTSGNPFTFGSIGTEHKKRRKR